jgi:hypothetical protein
MHRIAESYVKLVLAIGQHDPDYVDAYYGPDEWRPVAGVEPPPLARLRDEIAGLLDALASAGTPHDAMDVLRRDYLARQL